jgi:hypothetical protein
MNIKIERHSSRNVPSPKYQPRLYFFHPNESILENLVSRHFRPIPFYKKLLPKVFAQLGMKPVKAAWRQRCGCSCPCSPGFVLENGYQDIYVTLEASDFESEQKINRMPVKELDNHF